MFDALVGILYPDVHNAFQKYASQAGVALPDSLRLETQVSWRDASRPDLVGLEGKDQRILIVESKFWAPLTKNQPTAYINQLTVDKPALLLFIAPNDRLPILWQELVARCGIGDASAQATEEAISPFRALVLAANSNHRLALTSWESLLEVLTQQVGDSAALEDIRQLRSLCLSRTWPVHADKSAYEELIDTLVDRLVQTGIANVEGYKAVRRPASYKRYMTFNGFVNWCVEYNESYFERFYPSCLWLTKYLTKADPPQVSELLAGLNAKNFAAHKAFVTPLFIPDDDKNEVNEDMVLDSLYRQIEDIASQLHQ